LSTLSNAFPFAHGEAQIKLLRARFSFFGPTHVLLLLLAERMRPGVWGQN
jgi:hypothetical protein